MARCEVHGRRAKRGSDMLRVDMHVHSSASFDCRMDPAWVARRCARLGLAPTFLTDHDRIDGALDAQAAGVAGVVVGEEVTTQEGEIIGLFLSERVPAGLPTVEAVQRIKDQGGVVYLQHPFDPFRPHLSERAIEAVADDIDIVEVYNARSDDEANRRAADLCAALGLPAGAGSDAHRPGEIGLACVELEPFAGPADFLAKLCRGRVIRRPSRSLMLARGAFSPFARSTATLG